MKHAFPPIYILFLVLCLGLICIGLFTWSYNVYFQVNPLLMPFYFAITLLLFLIMFLEKSSSGTGNKLSLVIFHSFLTRVILLIAFFPGISGDPTSHLAHERTWDIFGRYYLNLSPTPLPEMQSLIGRIYTVQRGSVQYGLVVSLSKILCIDVFWVHTVTIAVLWSLFVPIIAFKVSKIVGTSDRAALLAGSLTASAPLLLTWSVGSTTNSFGFFFFFVTIYFLFRALRPDAKRRDTLLLFATTLVVMWIHSLTGLAALSLILPAFGLKKYQSLKHASHGKASFFMASFFMFSCFVTTAILPAAMSIALTYIYPIGAPYFSFEKMLGLDIYTLVFANYASYTFVQTIMYGALSFLGIIGMLIFRQSGEKRLYLSSLILAFIIVNVQYRVLLYFIENPIFGVSRLLVFLPFIEAPFAAITLDYIYANLVAKSPNCTEFKFSLRNVSAIKHKLASKQVTAAFLICVGLSAFIVEGNLISFRYIASFGPVGTDSIWAMDAARLLHEDYLRNGERYVVVADEISWDTGTGFVGTLNLDECYLPKGQNKELYIQTLKELSAAPLEQAAMYNNASLVYLMTTHWSVERYIGLSADYQFILESLNKMYEQFAVVGSDDGQIHVFRWEVRWEPLEGIGPEVSVIKDSELTNLNTTYSYKYLENITYTLTLTGASTYEVSNWPRHWSYEQISPAPINLSLDANTYINLTTNPASTYNITWFANEYHQNVVWKDDSFKSGIYIHHGAGNYSFASDGDVATESVEAEPGQYVLYQKDLPSVQGSSSLVARVKGSTNAYFAISLWNSTGTQRKELFYSRYQKCTDDYTLYVYSLPRNTTWNLIWLVSRTTDGNLAAVYWDYVMLLQD